MRRFQTSLFLALAIGAAGSSVLHATDGPPMTLASSTYYGQFGFDEATDVAVDAEGFVYVVGSSESFAGTDGFIVKLSPDGQGVYSMVLGGSGSDIATGVAVDSNGGVYVVGHTTSTDFPLFNAFQAEPHGDLDLWIAKLDAEGMLLYSTYYGGSSFEKAAAIAVGPSGAIYVGGSTGSTDLPAATGFQQVHGGGSSDGFVLKIRADGSGPDYATYLGGSDDEFLSGLAVDATDHAYVAGVTRSLDFPIAGALQSTYGGGSGDAFVTEFSPDGAQHVFSTYLGGSSTDSAMGIDVDQAGAVYLTGSTSSADFPIRNPYQPFKSSGPEDAFLTKLRSGGNGIDYSTFLGGKEIDAGVDVVVDDSGQAHVVGKTASLGFPLVSPIQILVDGVDGFYASFSADGRSLRLSTPLGGSASDGAQAMALSQSGDAWMVGRTESVDFPLVNAFQALLDGPADAFVARLTFDTAPPTNQPPVVDAGPDQTVGTTGCATTVVLDGSNSNDPDGDQLQFNWSGDFGTFAGPSVTLDLLPGSYTFTLTVDDGRGGQASDTVSVVVIDNGGPEIGTVSATPNVLRPPNHKMVAVSIAVDLTGACDAGSQCQIVSVSSNEPSNGTGDGDTSPDWELTGPLELSVRAERGDHSQGRIYTITIECVDAAGNASRRDVTVSVPKN